MIEPAQLRPLRVGRAGTDDGPGETAPEAPARGCAVCPVTLENAERMKVRSRNRLGLMLAVAALAVGACGGSSATAPRGSVPSSGGTLTVALASDMVYADPSLVSDASSKLIANQVVEGLVGLKPGTTSEIVPVLAAALPTALPAAALRVSRRRMSMRMLA